MTKKIVKLVDNRRCMGRTVRELRKALRGIDQGDIIGISFVTIKRNGNLFAYTDNECYIRALGSVELLKEHIRKTKFEAL